MGAHSGKVDQGPNVSGLLSRFAESNSSLLN